MKTRCFLAALFAIPVFAGEEAPAPAAVPAPAEPAAEKPAFRTTPMPLPAFLAQPPEGAGVRRPVPGPAASKTPEEEEHSRRMKALATFRDTKVREAAALEEEAVARKNAILAENEEAGELAKKIVELRAELDAATNALEKIFLADETLQAKLSQMRTANDAALERQRALNQEVAEAIRKRMEAQGGAPRMRPNARPSYMPKEPEPAAAPAGEAAPAPAEGAAPAAPAKED